MANPNRAPFWWGPDVILPAWRCCGRREHCSRAQNRLCLVSKRRPLTQRVQACRHRHPEQPGSRSWPALCRVHCDRSVEKTEAPDKALGKAHRTTPPQPSTLSPEPEPEHHQRHLASTSDVHAVRTNPGPCVAAGHGERRQQDTNVALGRLERHKLQQAAVGWPVGSWWVEGVAASCRRPESSKARPGSGA